MRIWKKLLSIIFCVVSAHTAFSADFSPKFMEISVPDSVYYAFDGSAIDIDVEISGAGGKFWLVINTKGQADNINMVQNGFMGWHTVNNIDTTVYISAGLDRQTGTQKIEWDGTNTDGNPAMAGNYDFYVYGYNDISSRVAACMFIQAGSGGKSSNTFIIENDENGNPLSNPILTTTVQGTQLFQAQDGSINYSDWCWNGAVHQWVLGGNPRDLNNLRWSKCDIYPSIASYNAPNYFFAGGTAFDPADHSFFYNVCHNVDGEVATILKWEFVNNGNAILQTEWGGWENETFDKPMPNGIYSMPMSTVTDGNYLYLNDSETTGLAEEGDWNWLYCYDFDGDEVFSINMPEFYIPDDPSLTESKNCAMLDMTPGAYENSMFLGTTGCCMHEFIDMSLLIDKGWSDEVDYLRWRNNQGDFFFDMNWGPNTFTPWACLATPDGTSQRIDTVQVDANGFNIIFASYIGSASHGVSTQDGTSLLTGGYMAFYDDHAAGSSSTNRGGGQIVDSGSTFDGMYTTRPPGASGGGDLYYYETWYIANASAHGVIFGDINDSVEEDAVSAFSVSQNSPNPFNPTTSIGFTLPESGDVSVEIFTVGGQKVETLVDDYMDAGQHSVVWDASAYSNGVYFYTVRAGELSKTKKMTLLK